MTSFLQSILVIQNYLASALIYVIWDSLFYTFGSVETPWYDKHRSLILAGLPVICLKCDRSSMQWMQTCSAGLRCGFSQSSSSIEQLRSIFILRLRWRNNVSLILCQIHFCLFWTLWGLEVPISLICVRISEIRLKDSCIVDQKAHNHWDHDYCDTTISLNETGRAISKFCMAYCCHDFFFNYVFFSLFFFFLFLWHWSQRFRSQTWTAR